MWKLAGTFDKHLRLTNYCYREETYSETYEIINGNIYGNIFYILQRTNRLVNTQIYSQKCFMTWIKPKQSLWGLYFAGDGWTFKVHALEQGCTVTLGLV